MASPTFRTSFAKLTLGTLLALGAEGVAAQAPTPPITVESFTPQGEVRRVQQAAVRFNADMVRLGEAGAPAPLDITCTSGAPEPRGRWIDARRFAYEWSRDLPVGTACTATLRPGIKGLDGREVAPSAPWTFATGGPKVTQSLPFEGSNSVRENQIFLLRPDARADAATLERHLQCQIEGRPAQAVTRLSRADGLRAMREYRQTMPEADWDRDHWMAVRCTEPLPNDANVRLVWGAQIAATTRVASRNDQILGYKVRPAFAVTLSCQVLADQPGCDVRGPLTLQFNAPVAAAVLNEVKVTTRAGARIALQRPERNTEEYLTRIVTEPLLALDGPTEVSVTLPAGLRDRDARALANSGEFPKTVKVARLPPYAGIVNAGVGVLPLVSETGKPAQLVIAARHVERTLTARTAHVSGAMGVAGETTALNLLNRRADWPKQAGESAYPVFASHAALALPSTDMQIESDGGAMAFQALPLRRPGLWLVELDSPAFRAARAERHRPPAARAALVQVTNLNIMTRTSGTGTSLVWVTGLDDGKPRADVEVALYGCGDRELWRGKTTADGSATFTARTPCPGDDALKGMRMIARLGEDMAILELSGYRPLQAAGPAVAHTILDRTLLKAGEELHLESHIRAKVAEGFRHLPASPGSAVVRFNHGEVVHRAEVQWTAQGTAQLAWRIPANAKLGQYTVEVQHRASGMTSQAAFQIEEFRTPVFDARLTGVPIWRSATQQVLPVAAAISFLSGGVPAGAKTTLRGTWEMDAPALRPGFMFVNQRLAPFRARPETPRTLTLDAAGKASTSLTPPETAHPLTLRAELEFADPNGEVQTVAQPYAVWPFPHKVGIQTKVLPGPAVESAGVGRDIELGGVVLDQESKPLAGKRVRFTAARARTNTSGFYELTAEEVAACEAVTAANGEARCTWRSPARAANAGTSGAWLFTVRADQEQHVSTAVLNDWQVYWVPSRAALEIEGLNSQDRTAMLDADAPATLRVRAPFFPATLLLAVEREGVLAHSVHRIDGADVRIPLNVKGQYAPNVMLNATLVRPLGAAAAAAESADSRNANLAGNEVRLQLSSQHSMEVRVRPSAFALAVKLQVAAPELRPRERAKVDVSVIDAGGKPASGARITLVAVDDALLALKPNQTWDLFAGMLQRRSSDVLVQGLDARIRAELSVGARRGFRPGDERLTTREVRHADLSEDQYRAVMPPTPPMPPMPAPMAARMAAPASVGMARLAAEPNAAADAPAPRSDFSSLALWRTDVVADARGTATVEVPLNDSLTRWRIVAIAGTTDQFGTGDATVRTTLPLQVISGLPISVRSGDVLEQKVTLRNTSGRALAVTFAAQAEMVRAEGVPVRAADAATLAARGLAHTRTVNLKAGENHELTWPVSVPDGTTQLKWRISARAAGLADAIDIVQTVTEAVPVTVRQATLLQVNRSAVVPVAQPEGARPLTGGVAVQWKASLADAALLGVRSWMQAYPFACFEQQLSKIAVAGTRADWDALMGQLPKYLDQSGLLRFFPSEQLPGSEILTLYLLDLSTALKWPVPETERVRMLGALRTRHTAQAKALDWAPQDAGVVLALARQATLAEQSGGPDAAAPVTPQEIDALPSNTLIDWLRYLLASPKLANRNEALRDAMSALRARYDVQGTRLNWRNDARENWWWFMWNGNQTAARTVWIAQRLTAHDTAWATDLPLLVTALTARQQRGHWGTTTANAWGAIALADFARARESEPVRGTSSVQLGGQTARSTWPDARSNLLSWPKQGAKDNLVMTHEGSGAPWATVAVTAAVKLDRAVAQGLSVVRNVVPVQQKVKGRWSVGDVARVTLTMNSNASLTWVAVRDPVPSGATILGRGLARESNLAQAGQRGKWLSPAFEERASESYRAFYSYVPKGEWSVDYTVRLNNAGQFEFPPVRVEAMYAPEIFGEAPVPGLSIGK